MESLVRIIPILSAVAAACWGIYVFNRQLKFQRLQNLSKILQRFEDKDMFINIFNLFDQSIDFEKKEKSIKYNEVFIDELKSVKPEDKLKFLVLLEEVALFAKSFEVDRDYAIHLFQWHFYYAYNNPKTSEAFWSNLGGLSETDEQYWKYQKDFSKNCKPIPF